MALEFAKALTSQIKNPTLNKAANASLNALGRVSSAYGSLKNMATGAKNAYTSAPAPVQSAIKTGALSTVLPLPFASAISAATTKKPAPAQTPGFTPASQSMLDALKRQQSTTPIKQPSVQQPTITSNGQQSNPYYFDNTSGSTSGSTTSATGPTKPQTSTPATPTVSPEMKAFLAQRQALMGQISSAMLPTEEELATSKKLQELQAQQANIAASEQLGLNKIEDQPIAMNFITGQQAALQRQAAAQSGALQAQQIPLQTQLAMIQAERQRKADIAKAQLESDTPIEVGGSLVNPVTGEVVYSGAKNAEGFTLGEGQARYDAQGNLLASAPKSEATMTPYQAAQLEIERQKLANIKPTEGQSKAAAFAVRTKQAEDTFDLLGSQFTGASSIIGKALPDILKSEDRLLFEQAQRNFINAVLRRESGAAISDSEFENARRQYIPQPGDTPAVLAQKKASRQLVTQGLEQEAGNFQIQPNSTTNTAGNFNW